MTDRNPLKEYRVKLERVTTRVQRGYVTISASSAAEAKAIADDTKNTYPEDRWEYLGEVSRVPVVVGVADERINEPALTLYFDRQRHLVCVPYTRDNLHRMAMYVGIKRCWYHASPYPHYDLPKTFRWDPAVNVTVQLVSQREILRIIRAGNKL